MQSFTPEEIVFSETYQPSGAKRPANLLTLPEEQPTGTPGCEQYRSISKLNDGGTIGTCTECHSRNTNSVTLVQLPPTCGHCYMGPDYTQIEIYNESEHGVKFAAQRRTGALDQRDGARQLHWQLRSFTYQSHREQLPPPRRIDTSCPLGLCSGLPHCSAHPSSHAALSRSLPAGDDGQALVDVLDLWYHLQANLVLPAYSVFKKLVNGAPPLAPLLFLNLVALA